MREPPLVGDTTSLRPGRDLPYFKHLAWVVGLPFLFAAPFAFERLGRADARALEGFVAPFLAGAFMSLVVIGVHELIAFHRMAPWKPWMHHRDGRPRSFAAAMIVAASSAVGSVIAQHTVLSLTAFGWAALVVAVTGAVGLLATGLYLLQFPVGASSDGLTESLYGSAGFNLFVPESWFIREWTTSSSNRRGASQTLVWGTNSAPERIVAGLDDQLLPAGFERGVISPLPAEEFRPVVLVEYVQAGTSVRVAWLRNDMPRHGLAKWFAVDPMQGDRATVYVTVANGRKAEVDGPWMPPGLR